MLNKVCSILYEVAFLLFFVLVILAPLHAAATRHLTVVQTLDSSHATLAGDMRGLAAGSSVALYRFNYDWKIPIGSARIESIAGQTAQIALYPNTMRWPLGKSGTVVRGSDGNTYVTLGSSAGIAEGDYLKLFRERKNVGQAQVSKVFPDRSMISVPGDLGDPSRLVASEFSFATQAVLYDDPLLSGLEFALISFALVAYAVLYVRTKRSPFILLGEKISARAIPKKTLFWAVNVLVGIPFTWFMAKMPLYVGAYLASYVSAHFFSQYVYLVPLANTILPYAYGGIAFLYYGYLLWKRQSPALAFWKFISYHGHSAVKVVTFKRGFVMWALHLIIVYVFAWTLWDFLRGDISAALSIGIPPSREAFFEQAKYIVWALTVVGVLIGYGYSVVSILWGRYIRNLDFTITGWLTNAFCYPLLGVVIWQIIPSFTGADPTITAGPLQSLMLVLGLFLNVFYMLSIFNLGFMFDLMTDKGVRKSGFYSVIRHPNYTLEVSMFFVTELIGLTAGIEWLAICMYFFIYWIRSEREDNFMEYSNPEYEPYQQTTPYKFIPGIY